MLSEILRIVFFLTIPIIAIVFEGMHRKFMAMFQHRIGPPVVQPFYDLRKLWHKQTLEDNNDPFFKNAPFFYFLSTYALFLIIPFSLLAFDYDFIFLIYLTILSSGFYVLAGVSSDSPFSITAAMREMVLMVCYEVVLAVSVFSFVIVSGGLSLSSISSHYLAFSLPLASFALIAVSVVELKITPFDTAEAEPEVLTSVETEYSGRRLFFMELTNYMRRLFYVLLVPLLLFGLRSPFLYVTGGFFTLIGLSLSQASTPRYRVDQAFKSLFFIMIIALIEFIRVLSGLVWVF